MRQNLIYQESKLAGLLLLLGGITIIITIGFEHSVGWIGVEPIPSDEVPLFIKNNWSSLKSIWGWQALGFLSCNMAYLLLFKSESKAIKSLIWGILFLCTSSIVIAFGITLGAYGKALSVYPSDPILFVTIRSIVRTLYLPGLMGLLFLGGLYLIETFSNEGIIPRKNGFIGASIIVLAIVLSMVPGLPGKTIGGAIFLLPIFIGWTYFSKSNSIEP